MGGAGATASQVQAVERAIAHLTFGPYSKPGLIEQLDFEGLTPEQAEHGATAAGL